MKVSPAAGWTEESPLALPSRCLPARESRELGLLLVRLDPIPQLSLLFLPVGCGCDGVVHLPLDPEWQLLLSGRSPRAPSSTLASSASSIVRQKRLRRGCPVLLADGQLA